VTSNDAQTGTKMSSWRALTSIVAEPRSTLRAIGQQPRHRWLLPFILMLAGIACLSLVTMTFTPQAAAGRGYMQGPPGAAAPGQEQATRPSGQMEGRPPSTIFTDPVLRQVIPATARLLGGLLGWVLFAGVLYVTGLVVGGGATYGQVFAVVSWSWIPYILRDFFQAGYIFATGRLIRLPGLAFLAATGDAADLLYLALAQVDIFLLWHLLLIGLGVAVLNRFGWGKTLFVVLVYLLIVVGLALVPALIRPLIPGGSFLPMRGVRTR
jgi:hypothetical protein